MTILARYEVQRKTPTTNARRSASPGGPTVPAGMRERMNKEGMLTPPLQPFISFSDVQTPKTQSPIVEATRQSRTPTEWKYDSIHVNPCTRLQLEVASPAQTDFSEANARNCAKLGQDARETRSERGARIRKASRICVRFYSGHGKAKSSHCTCQNSDFFVLCRVRSYPPAPQAAHSRRRISTDTAVKISICSEGFRAPGAAAQRVLRRVPSRVLVTVWRRDLREDTTS